MTTVQKKIQTLMGKWLDDGATIEFENFRDELEFTRELKLRLKKIGLGDIGKMILNVPASVAKRFHDFNLRHKRVYRATEGFVSSGKLRIHHGTIVPLVIEAFKETVSYIEEIVSRPKNKDLTDIILFGDLAEFSITADILRSKLRQSIHIAEDVGVAIPKGGVLFGLSPEIVTSRILRIAGDEKGCDIWATPKVIAQHQVFAAFDIGTTYSGYAYSVKNNPTEIWTNKAWNAGEQLLSLKTPTSVLLKPDKTFDSFGFEAENKYSSLVEDEEHLNWMLFRRFKMMLHQTKDGLHRDTMVEDISGKKMPALTIFSMAIRYLKEQLMETLHLRIPDISESDILYVITVPAIWSDGAKQFMKEAAKQAGIDSDQVGLALEPEAAAIWCQHIQTDVKGEMSKPGTQFMVVDVGGGTTDISVQEKQPDKRITEIHCPDGGAWGGTNVDKKFHDWFGSIFGQKTIHHFETSMFGEYLEFLKVFETKKRSNIGNTFFIRIPFSLLAKSTEAKKTIEMLGLSEKVRIVNEKLKVDPEIVKLWFRETISNISFNIKKVLQEPHLENVRLVMVVGGFAECQLLQSALKEKLPNVRVVIPEDAGIAVLKGAVEFAQRPHVIASRVMKCSYGINKPFEYDAKVHDSSKVVMENGQKVVHLFEKFVTINNTVKIGEVISKGFKPTTLNETKVDIYSSSHPDPRYISDKGCTKIGEIIVKHNNGKTAEDKLFNVLFEFGKTEIFVRVIMRISCEEFGTTLDCL
ncbi:heat shock 70 kDa protein 12A-like [Mya arenaria]|uniref:heat shock 70 kDa protein 12A-like n=1 Tax=Mya arenaria TaxID=6604 RepID=UPI0022E720D5|nr:heat shock 70 kDa protein 12A-like [Mya arenaria]XP_052795594.1 heat shock 70 kDa protein 12A-like [Mya arenaria]XP_052795595.1 heat shock 70 kDa protein 12A-like [Mya arenaria]